MKRPLPIIFLGIVALILSAGCATTTPTPVSRDHLHAFVQRAKAEHGPNRGEWPQDVQEEFDRLFESYLSTRNPEVSAHE